MITASQLCSVLFFIGSICFMIGTAVNLWFAFFPGGGS